MLKSIVLLATLIAAPLAAQPLEAEAPDRGPVPDHLALDAVLTAVVHHGRVVLLWDAFPGATQYRVEIARPGAPLAEALRLDVTPSADAAGYSAHLDLSDGRWAVRLVAVGTGAASAPRALTVEAPDVFERDAAPEDNLYAAND